MSTAISTRSANNPFAEQTDDDYRGGLYVTTVLCFIFVLITCIVRGHVRFRASGLDDWAIGVACAVGFAQYAAVLVGATHGLGSREVESNGSSVAAAKAFLASEALFVSTVFLAKHATIVAIDRLLARDMRAARLVCQVLHALSALGAIASLATVTARCSANGLLLAQPDQRCASQIGRWAAVTAVDGITDLAIFGAFCWIMWPVQMRKRLKATVIVLLGLRLVCPVLAAVHAYYISTYTRDASPSLGVVSALLWQEIDMTYSLLSTLVLALKNFLANFDTSLGNERTYAAGSRSGGPVKSYNLKRLTRSGKGNTQLSNSDVDMVDRPQDAVYTAKIYHADSRMERQPSVGSGNSQRPIIRHEVRYSVAVEERADLHAPPS